ncbi:hypothetical protein HD597_000136 [Nonomuraea thailandensis]|uniref:Uncharacterized protein n=1 Tax=Nonomuraea thailandensis TaxID=1188745 RepID=A0A9X2GD72_9ACTN|nr:hypothetical protein [Nonomuraea thailandensis]MCP2353116.1 hypothetical protein [Nonomuraea thailandensis]
MATDPVPPVQDRVRAPRRARRLLLGAVATALMAVAMTVGPSILGAPDEVYAGEAVTVDRDGNDYVFYFTKGDPDPESLRKAFRSVGLDVSVTLVPVSPRDPFPYFSLVRNGGIQTSYRSAECAERVGGCLGSMRVSAELTGPAEFRLGRPARPGEPYVASVDATLPGEVLAGVQIDGKTAAEVVRIARERGLRVIYTIDWPLKEGVGFSTEGFEGEIPASRIDPAWAVASVETYNDGAIIMHVLPGPGATPPPEFCRHHGDTYPPIAC